MVYSGTFKQSLATQSVLSFSEEAKAIQLQCLGISVSRVFHAKLWCSSCQAWGMLCNELITSLNINALSPPGSAGYSQLCSPCKDLPPGVIERLKNKFSKCCFESLKIIKVSNQFPKQVEFKNGLKLIINSQSRRCLHRSYVPPKHVKKSDIH